MGWNHDFCWYKYVRRCGNTQRDSFWWGLWCQWGVTRAAPLKVSRFSEATEERGGRRSSECSGVMRRGMGKSWVYGEGGQNTKSQKEGKVEGKRRHKVGWRPPQWGLGGAQLFHLIQKGPVQPGPQEGYTEQATCQWDAGVTVSWGGGILRHVGGHLLWWGLRGRKEPETSF